MSFGRVKKYSNSQEWWLPVTKKIGKDDSVLLRVRNVSFGKEKGQIPQPAWIISVDSELWVGGVPKPSKRPRSLQPILQQGGHRFKWKVHALFFEKKDWVTVYW